MLHACVFYSFKSFHLFLPIIYMSYLSWHVYYSYCIIILPILALLYTYLVIFTLLIILVLTHSSWHDYSCCIFILFILSMFSLCVDMDDLFALQDYLLHDCLAFT